jgi:signal transduction histidine kinase
MQRAHRALGLLLAVVLALACVAVYFVYRSGRNRVRAEQAEAEATERLWRASLARARAERTNTQAGHRDAALEAVRAAAAIRPSVELRNEAIAALRSLDFEVEVSWDTGPNARGISFDPDLEYYAVRQQPDVVSLFRLQDNSHVRDYPRPAEAPPDSAAMDYQFSATGKYLAVRYENGPLVLFERDTGTAACMLGMDAVTARYTWPPSFTADDRTMGLTLSGSDGTFVLYDIEKREARRPARMPKKLVYVDPLNQVAVSPRGDLLAWYDGIRIYLLDAVSGEVKHETIAPTAVKTIDWDQRGERLAFGCGNATLFLLEAESGRVLQMGGRTVQPWVQRFNEDGTLLLTSGRDGVTSLWDVTAAKLLCQSNEARGLAISRRGDRIGWGIPRQKVGVWRVARPSADLLLQGRYSNGATVWQQDFSADGRRAVWSPPTWLRAGALELCDTENNRQGVLQLQRKASAGFLPGTDRIWITADGALTLHDWPDLTNLPREGLPEAGRIPLPAGLNALMAAFSEGARYAAVACAGGELLALDTANLSVPVILEQGVKFTADVPGPSGPSGSGSLAISPDGKWVVAGRDTAAADPTVWDARTGRLAVRLPCPAAHVCFSPDSRWLVTIGIRSIQLWSVGTWREHWSKSRPATLAGYLGAAAFSGDGSLLAWTRDLDEIEIAEPSGGDALASFHVSRLYPLTGLRFSGDGSRIFATGPEGKAQVIHAGALRKDHLAGLGLDWTAAPASVAAVKDGDKPGTPGWVPVVLGLVPVAAAGLLGMALYRRQGRLATEFIEAAELASDKERELTAEREVSELKSRFVTTVSHEFRTPLGITMSAVELLRHYEDRLPPEEKAQLFDDIHSATRNMAGLMEQVLVLGRVDAGKLAYHPAALDLDVLARKLADESLSATNRKCPIEWRAENDLSGARADEALLRHILTNLLSNGVKYSPAGTPVQFTGRREGREAVFTVQDRGIGIPEADLPKLFEAFHRGSNVGEIPGTGLGLVIIKRCVDLHGGSVRVESKPGEGTTFTVRVPAW